MSITSKRGLKPVPFLVDKCNNWFSNSKFDSIITLVVVEKLCKYLK